MGVEPPFIYDRPSTYTFAGPTQSSFNPKAATQASWTPKQPKQKQKSNGPLVDFNKHPDTYVIVPYGNVNAVPMPPTTRKRVIRARNSLFFLRVVALLACLGLLFCCIAINKTSSTVGWIVRLGPAIAACHLVYAIYHLCRAVESRTPASTASYMVFAAMVDTGLIPFFTFSAFMAHADYTSNAYGWSTLFGNTDTSYKVIFAFFILSASEGGLMLGALILDVYLAVVFRKIAKLPPDMNPLEPNLTARPHKRNKSEITEKHMSGSTLASKRMSQFKEQAARRVPFTHTRTDSADSVTLHGGQSARNSHQDFRKELDASEADGYYNQSRETIAPTRPASAVNPAENARAAGAGIDYRPARSSGLANLNSSRPSSWLSYMDYEGVPIPLSETANQQLNDDIRAMSPVSAMSSRDPSMDRAHAERSNWYNQPNHSYSYSHSHSQSQTHLSPSNRDPFQLTKPSTAPPSPPYTQSHQKKRSRDPLGMNPPTPTMPQFQDQNNNSRAQSELEMTPTRQQTEARPALQETNLNVDAGTPTRPTQTSRPSSFIGSGGKSRFYGNLRTSIGPTGLGHEDTERKVSAMSNDNERTHTMQSDNSGNFETYGTDSESDSEQEYNNRRDAQNESPSKATYAYQEQQMQNAAAMQIATMGSYDSPTSTSNPGTPSKSRNKPVYFHPNGSNSAVNSPIAIKTTMPSPSRFNPSHTNSDAPRQVSNSTGYDLHNSYAGLGSEFGKGMASRRREVSGKVAEEGRSISMHESHDGFSDSDNGSVVAGQPRPAAAGWARFKGL